MIFARLNGGLGNQLFQYAAGRAASLRAGVDLALDLRALDGRVGHAVYGLDKFAIAARVEGVAMPPPRGGVAYALWRAGLSGGPRFLRERGGFDARVLRARSGTYLHGYFQTEDYFADQAGALRQDLCFQAEAEGEVAEWLSVIAEDTHAVSLHVRRGDYLAEAQRGGICDAGYYRRALGEVAARIGAGPNVYVFSDDPAWARENLSFAQGRVVSSGGGRHPAEELRLMAACRHHVIANSTFSWWGAWLNPSAAKVVVAPKRWTLDGAHDAICPTSWLRV